MTEAKNTINWSLFLASSSDHDNKKNVNTDQNNNGSSPAIASHVKKMVSENKVLVFGRRGCFMCYVMKRLLLGIGENPAVYEVDEEDEEHVIDELVAAAAAVPKEGRPQFPVVCIGGRLFGGLDRLMAAHITGELEPVLKDAGSLWL